MEVVDSSVAILLLRPRHKLAKIIYVILQRSVLHLFVKKRKTKETTIGAGERYSLCGRSGQRRGAVQQEIAAASVDPGHSPVVGFRGEDDAAGACAGEQQGGPRVARYFLVQSPSS